MSRPATSHEPFAEWAALASIQALDGDEQVRFEAHLAAGCAECEETQRELALAAAALPLALPEVSAPPELRDRLLAGSRWLRASPGRWLRRARSPFAPAPGGGRQAGRGRCGRLHGVGPVSVAVRAGAAAGLRGAARTRTGQPGILTSLVAGTDSSVAALKGTPPAPQADGSFAWSPARKSGFLVAHNLPMPPAGKQYQLWVIAAGQPASAGVFDVDNLGHASLVVPVEAPTPDGFAITLEPAGGGPRQAAPRS